MITDTISMKNVNETIWHDHPAEKEWLRALPLGNGRMGAMVFGNPGLERIQLNEDTFYALEPDFSHVLPEGVPEALPGVIQLLKDEKIEEAEAQVSKNWLGRSNAPYLPMADLWIEQNHQDIHAYTHSLSLADGLAMCRYIADGKTYQRETFMSFPDQALVIRLSCDVPGSICFRTWIDSPHRKTLHTAIEGNTFIAKGQGPGEALRRDDTKIKNWHDEKKYPHFYEADGNGETVRKPGCGSNVLYGGRVGGSGMVFETRLRMLPTGGTFTEKDGHLVVKDADEVLLILTADTSFNGMNKSPSREGVDPSLQTLQDLDAASAHSFETLKKRHVEDYQHLYQRVAFEVGKPGEPANLPTDLRIENYAEGKDPTLSTLYYQFSRYLMIAGSRPGSEPLNLQGIWNEEVIPPWNSGYTTNINAQMNYWDVYRANLSECTEPFLRMVFETYENGKKVASTMFGYRGWCMFHNLSIWRSAAPVDGEARTSWWPVGAGWFCQHLWGHYLQKEDRSFLKKSYPVMRDAALFFSDWVIDRGDGNLVTPVSTSPENRFILRDENGAPTPCSLSMGSTMDMAIIRETLTNTLKAADVLGIDGPELYEIQKTLDGLLDYQIGRNNTLMEWSEDFEEEDPEHRHLSHLYGFFPGEELTPEKRPDLINAVRATLDRRGDGASGWSMGWKLNCWARFGDGPHFEKLLNHLLTPERTAPNGLDLHPPYQIDGNFGVARGMTEVLVQDHRGFIELLPALPPCWKNGFIRGICVRGGAEVDVEWKESKVVSVTLRSLPGKAFKVRIDGQDRQITLPPSGGITFSPSDPSYFQTKVPKFF